MKYAKPKIERVATFKQSTAGLTFGRFRDLFGARAIIVVRI